MRGGVLHLAVTQNGHRHGNSMATSTIPSANRPRAEQQIGGGGGNRTGVRKHSVWWGRLPRARAPNRGVVMHEATALGFSWREEIRWRCHRRTTAWQLSQVSLPPRTRCRPLSLDRDVLKPLAVELSAALALPRGVPYRRRARPACRRTRGAGEGAPPDSGTARQGRRRARHPRTTPTGASRLKGGGMGEDNEAESRWVSIAEASREENVPARTLYRWRRSNAIASKVEDGVTLVRLADVRACAGRGRVDTPAPASGSATAIATVGTPVGATAGNGAMAGKVTASPSAELVARLFRLFDGGMALEAIVQREQLLLTRSAAPAPPIVELTDRPDARSPGAVSRSRPCARARLGAQGPRPRAALRRCRASGPRCRARCG